MAAQVDSKPYYICLFSLIFTALICFFVAQQLTGEALQFFIKEGGLIESLSAAGYLICIALMIKLGGKAYVSQYWYFVVVLASFSARELDFDKRFTAVGVLKSKFLFSPEVSVVGKLIGLSIIVLVLFSLFKIVRNHGKAFLTKVFSFGVLELSVAVAGAFLVISKSLDGLARKLVSLDIHISKALDRQAGLMEESLELAIPYLFCIAVMYFFALQRK